MADQKHVVLLFGGRSAEHDVSILSARSIREATPRDKFHLTPICIARDGLFIAAERSAAILDGTGDSTKGERLFLFDDWCRQAGVDIVFPIIHGTFGEDGCLQGYLEILGIPYIGSGVTGSAVGMDKWMMKYAFAAAKLPIVEFTPVSESEWAKDRELVLRGLGNSLRLPYFVKPANAGSSVGVSKVKNDSELDEAVRKAFRFDEKILVERGIDAREIEVSVLGNDHPEASVAGEIITGREFYDYEDKYVDDKSSLVIPAKLSEEKSDDIRKLAIRAFEAVGASGYARVDFFLERGTNRVFVNELNTIPGFTKISMYPKLWEASGVKYGHLIEKLISLGFERSERRQRRLEETMRFFDEVKPLT